MTGIAAEQNSGIVGADGIGPDLPLDPSGVELLTEICASELTEAFGLVYTKPGPLRSLARRVAAPVARDAARYDHVVGERGLRAGGSWAMERVARSLEVQGQGNVPREGPLLLVANHPGLLDTVALFSAIPRDDLRVIAARRDFLDALPNTADHLFILDEQRRAGRSEFGVVREAARHMKRGGAVLTFPGGRIEPDPAMDRTAAAALSGWSESFDLFARLVPGLKVVPAAVSGVTSRRALRNPVLFVRSGERERRWLAATLQMLLPALYPTNVRVGFGDPLVTDGLARDAIAAALLEGMRRLIQDTQHA